MGTRLAFRKALLGVPVVHSRDGVKGDGRSSPVVENIH